MDEITPQQKTNIGSGAIVACAVVLSLALIACTWIASCYGLRVAIYQSNSEILKLRELKSTA